MSGKLMGAMGTATQYTFEQFEQLPDAPGKRELLDGELVEMPPPKLRHTLIAHGLMTMLRDVAAARGMTVLLEAGFRIGPRTYVQPDVAVLQRKAVSEATPDGYLEGAPLLAIEVASDANTAAAIDQKVKLYLDNGGEEVWIVHPKTRRVWVHRRGDAAAVAFDGIFESGVLGSSVKVQDIFGKP
jgi:Uma2 family endonuclease